MDNGRRHGQQQSAWMAAHLLTTVAHPQRCLQIWVAARHKSKDVKEGWLPSQGKAELSVATGEGNDEAAMPSSTLAYGRLPALAIGHSQGREGK